MKKFVGLLLFFLVIFLSGCTASSGYRDELTASTWQTTLDGGAEVSLQFDGDKADLTIDSAGERVTLQGKCLADERRFVIFVPSLRQNYGFDYIPDGDKLHLSYSGNTITLERSER